MRAMTDAANDDDGGRARAAGMPRTTNAPRTRIFQTATHEIKPAEALRYALYLNRVKGLMHCAKAGAPSDR